MFSVCNVTFYGSFPSLWLDNIFILHFRGKMAQGPAQRSRITYPKDFSETLDTLVNSLELANSHVQN